MNRKNKIIEFEDEFAEMDEELSAARDAASKVSNSMLELESEIQSLINELPEGLRPVRSYETKGNQVDESLKSLNNSIRDLSSIDLDGDINLSTSDILVSTAAGVIATIIDIVFVGTPEVVKLYRGGENFDGSRLTSLLRRIGGDDGKLSVVFETLSDKCKVPYDISAAKGVVNPNNHRLRSFAHDPLMGLLFAIVDILLGTSTFIDNDGKLRILVNNKDYPVSQKYFSVLYYLGHLVSDVCTARGLPIPGFILTQFFAGNEASLAKIAEAMYLDGYDIRHLGSMSTPVVIKNLVIDLYCRLIESDNNNGVDTIAHKEILEHKKTAYKYRLRLISDAVCCGGNVLKFCIPPTSGNMTALNLPEWMSLLQDTIATLKYQIRDKNVETVLANRSIIDDNWRQLLV